MTILQVINGFDLGGTEGQFVEMLRRIDRVRFRPVVCCLTRHGRRLADVQALGLEPEELPLRGSLARANSLRQIWRLARRIESSRADLVHAHDLYSNLLAAAAGRLARVPVLISRRDVRTGPTPALAMALRAAMRSAAHVLANAEAVKQTLALRDGIRPGKIAVVHNGVDLGAFDGRAAAGPEGPLPPLDPPWVVQVANMHGPHKGHPELLRACAASPGWRLVLLGTGAHRPTLERMAVELGIGPRVSFLGSRPDVPAVLARARVAVLASHGEGLPNGVLEAMAARLPVVATCVGGTPELVVEGETGHLVLPGDAGALAGRIAGLVDHPRRAQAMGAAGRRRIEARFTAERMAAGFEALYEAMEHAHSKVNSVT